MEEVVELFAPNGGTEGLKDYSKLVAWAKEQVSIYDGLVVQEDAIQSAKSDTARLRKIAKNASDYRIALKKEHESKIEETVRQLQEITKIFNDAADAIDSQVKGFEERRKAEKKSAIQDIFDEVFSEWKTVVDLAKVEGYSDGKWMNKGTSLESIRNFMEETKRKIEDGISALKGLGTKFEREMIWAFLQRLDMSDAIKKKAELDEFERQMKLAELEKTKKQAEQNAQKESQKEEKEGNAEDSQQKIYTVTFSVFGTKEEVLSVSEFMKTHNIKYQRK